MPLIEGVLEREGLLDGDLERVKLGERDLLGVNDGERDLLGVKDGVRDGVRDLLGLTDGERVLDLDLERVTVTVRLRVFVPVCWRSRASERGGCCQYSSLLTGVSTAASTSVAGLKSSKSKRLDPVNDEE